MLGNLGVGGSGTPAKSTGFFNPIYRSWVVEHVYWLWKNKIFGIKFYFSDFYLFFVCIHCLIIGSLQPVTKYVPFYNYNYCFLNHSHELITLMFVILTCMYICRPIARRRTSWLSYSCLARKSTGFYTQIYLVWPILTWQVWGGGYLRGGYHFVIRHDHAITL